jgi:hypothetical protein
MVEEGHYGSTDFSPFPSPSGELIESRLPFRSVEMLRDDDAVNSEAVIGHDGGYHVLALLVFGLP